MNYLCCRFNFFTNKVVKKNIPKPIYNCTVCNLKFDNIKDLDYHNKLKCKDSNIYYNNIYKFNQFTLGENIYKDYNGGNIYIIQIDMSMKDYYKIGITTNLQNRISTYRSGSVIEPRLHYYFPIKHIKEVDKTLKNYLIKYNVKREIYKINNLEHVINIIKTIQKEYESNEIEIIPELKQCDLLLCNKCNTVYLSYHNCL